MRPRRQRLLGYQCFWTIYLSQYVTLYGGYDNDGVPSNTPNPYVSRGAGVPYIAGLIRKLEIDQGHIDHALAMAFDWPSSTFVYPASKVMVHQVPT